MADKEIIKALSNMSYGGHSCMNCKYEISKGEERCGIKGCNIARNAIDLINRQKAEIERLQKRLELAEQCISEVEDAAYRGGSNDYIDSAIDRYSNLVKEMTEEGK